MDQFTDGMLNKLVSKILDNLYQDNRFSIGIKSDEKLVAMLAKHYLTINLDNIILQCIRDKNTVETKEIVMSDITVGDILLDSISSSNGEDYTVGKFTDFQ